VRHLNRIVAIVVAALFVLLAISSTFFTVDQRHYAIVFKLGEVTRVISEPGLNVKIPLIENVVYLDKRIQTIDNAEADRYITAEKKNLLVDLFVKWQIVDPREFYISFHGDQRQAQDRLAQIIRAALNEEFTKRTVREVVSSQRENVMQGVRSKVSADAAQVGIAILDVRLKRVDLLAEISESVYKRMEAERKRVANELRSTGGAEAEQIRADADRQRQVILAEAYRRAQGIKGEGDAKASQIYADAYGKDPQFYRFYRSLEAYRASFSDPHDLIIADPNSEFFQFMKSPSAVGNGKK
jgi:modulator of FtsH protease HflC